VVAPDPDVAIAPLGFDAVVVAVRQGILIDVAVRARGAFLRLVVRAADAVLEPLMLGARTRDLVPAENILRARVLGEDSIGAADTARRPGSRAPTRRVQPGSLDQDLRVIARRRGSPRPQLDGTLVVLARIAPSRDVARRLFEIRDLDVFDHDVVEPVGDLNAAPQPADALHPPHHDIRGVYGDAVVVRGSDADLVVRGAVPPVVDLVAACRVA